MSYIVSNEAVLTGITSGIRIAFMVPIENARETGRDLVRGEGREVTGNKKKTYVAIDLYKKIPFKGYF